MRIAISGSHRTGKSTLVAALEALLPGHKLVAEPYHLMEEDGHEFANPPSLDDLVAQLERSLIEVNDAGVDTIFDRCPIDLFAYILTHEDTRSFDVEEWLPGLEEAVKKLDLVVFVPIEFPDRITFAASDDENDWRATVDEKLRELLLDDSFDLDPEVMQVQGDTGSRAQSILARLRRKSQ